MIKYGIVYLELMWELPVISPTLSISHFWPETIIVIAYTLMLVTTCPNLCKMVS